MNDELIELAIRRFGDRLPPSSHPFLERFFRAVAAGERLVLGTDLPLAADAERSVPAEWIAWLCTDRDASERVSHLGVQLQGAWIQGALNLAHAKLSFPLLLESCRFEERISLYFAQSDLISLENSSTRSIDARGLRLQGALRLCRGFRLRGRLLLHGAVLDGYLNLSDGVLDLDTDSDFVPGLGDYVLIGDGMTVTKYLFARGDCTVLGGISLHSATIGCDLDMSGLHLSSASSPASGPARGPSATPALYAPLLKVGGDALLRGRASDAGRTFQATGAVNLLGARIDGNLNMNGARLSIDLERASESPDAVYSLLGERLRIGGDVFLNNGFRSAGAMLFRSAVVGGSIFVQSSTLLGGRHRPADGGEYTLAFHADRIRVAGNVAFVSRSEIIGAVRLMHARIDGACVWVDLERPELASLDARLADVGVWVDDAASWPSRLDVDGLVYRDLRMDPPGVVRTPNRSPPAAAPTYRSPLDLGSRLSWLELVGRTSATVQPYEQLALVLRKNGRERDARHVLQEKERRLSKDRSPLMRTVYRISGYGYSPAYLWIALVLTIAAYGLLYDVVHQSAPELLRFSKATGQDAAVFPPFQSLAFSADVFLPIVTFGQDAAWMPDPHQGRILIKRIPGTGYAISTGGLLLLAYWIEIVIGWVLSTMLAVSITNYFKR